VVEKEDRYYKKGKKSLQEKRTQKKNLFQSIIGRFNLRRRSPQILR
jgi:hypothetical protein